MLCICRYTNRQTLTRIVSGCLIVALLMNTAGCYSFRQIPATADPRGQRESKYAEQTLRDLTGKKVKVVFKNGKSITGIVIKYQAPYWYILEGHKKNAYIPEDITEISTGTLNRRTTIVYSALAFVVVGGILFAIGAHLNVNGP